MKVVAFIGNLSKGGAQGVFVNTINYLYEEGLDISVVVQNLHDAVYKDMLNPKISIASLNSKSAKEMLPALKKYVSSHKFTHTFVFGPEITVNLYIIRKLLHKDFKILSRCLNRGSNPLCPLIFVFFSFAIDIGGTYICPEQKAAKTVPKLPIPTTHLRSQRSRNLSFP